MRIYNSSGVFDLGYDFSADFEIYNPFFSDQGEQSMPLTLPPTKNNYRLTGFPQQWNRKSRVIQDQDIWIEIGPKKTKGRLVISEPDDDRGISCTIYYGNGMFYSDLTYPDGSEKMMVDLAWPVIDLGTPSAAVTYLYNCMISGGNGFDGFVFPVAMRYGYSDWNERESTLGGGVSGTKEYGTKIFFDTALNYPAGIDSANSRFYLQARNADFQIKTDSDVWTKHPLGYGATLFLKLGYVLDFIFKSFGYTFTDNPFLFDSVLQLQCLLNNTADAAVTGKIEYKNLLPTCEISTFIKSVEEKYGLKFILKGKTVSVRFRKKNAAGAELADMDVSTLKAEFPKITWDDFKQLKLSCGRSIEYASTELDTFELFQKKYTGVILSANSPTDLKSTSIADGVYFCRNVNAFFTKKTVYADDGSSSKSIEFTGSNFYDKTSNSTALAYEEHATGDEHVPMVLMAFAQDGSTYALPVAVPFIGEPRNLYTTLYLNKNAQTEDSKNMPIMFATRTKVAQSVTLANSSTVYQYWGGTTNIYSNDGTSDCSDIDMRNNGYDPDSKAAKNMYNLFWKEHDTLLRTSLKKVKCNLNLSAANLLAFYPETSKMLDNQRVLPMSLKYGISADDKITVSEQYFLTQRSYNDSTSVNTYQLSWIGFVCELSSSGLQINQITTSIFVNGNTLLISAASEYNISSGTRLKISIYCKYTISWVQDYTETIDVYIESGNKYGESTVLSGAVFSNYKILSVSISPVSDSSYAYVKSGQINSGYARSISLSVEKYVDGVVESIITYDGKQPFSYNGHTYALISDSDLRNMSYTNYMQRLSDFSAWFSATYAAQYPGLPAVNTSGARILNTTACPV